MGIDFRARSSTTLAVVFLVAFTSTVAGAEVVGGAETLAGAETVAGAEMVTGGGIVAGVVSGPFNQEQEAAPRQVPASTVHPEARVAIDRLWSPYCPGFMLEVCTSSGGAMLRDSIDEMARRGLEADSIVELILAEYGEEYRAEPLSEGFGGFAWFIPPAALIAGVIAVGAFLARRRGSRPHQPPAEEPSDEEKQRLAEAMAALDRDEAPDF